MAGCLVSHFSFAPLIRGVAAIFLLGGLASAVPSANGAEFGAVDVQSHVGELLYAEVMMTPMVGERLDQRCVRVADSLDASLPVLRQVSIKLLDAGPGDERKLLRLESRQSILDPAIAVLIDIDCGAGKSRQELALTLLRPLQSGRGEGASAAGPVRERVPAVRIAPQGRPALRISAVPSDEAGPARRREERVSGAGIEPLLRMSDRIGTVPVVNDSLRQVLRLEYRLLITLNEQLYAHSAAALQEPAAAGDRQNPRSRPEAGSFDRAPQPAAVSAAENTEQGSPSAVPLPAVIVTDSPAPEIRADSASARPPAASVEPAPEVPPAARNVSLPQAPAAVVPADNSDWHLPLVGVAIALLLLGVMIVRRRRQPLPEVPPSADFGDTVVMTHDVPGVPSASQSPVSEGGNVNAMNAFFASPGGAVAGALPGAPASAEPVMELAEIMLSFGRLQGAAQTLQEYIEAHPGEDLQPWVKLLEIYRSGEMRDEFEALSRRFNHNFNVEVQHWEAEPAAPVDAGEAPPKALTLEEIPHIREQLVASWGKPECIDYLRKLLHDNRGGQRSGFRLPVVQEILLLLDIAVLREQEAA